MAIPMPIVQDIRRLDRQGMSRAQIARRLHVDRGTVAKYADMEDCAEDATDDGIDATVDVSELMGSELHLHVNSNGKDVVIVVPTTDIDLDAVHGSHKPVKYSFKPELMHFFDKETEKNIF